MNDNKPLDLFAVLLLVISVLLVILAVLLRSYLNDLAMQQKVESIAGYQGVWVALPDELLWLPNLNDDSKQSSLQTASLKTLNTAQAIKLTKESLNLATNTENSIVSMSFLPNKQSTSLWLRTLGSGVFHCEIKIQSPASIQLVKPCQSIINSPENYLNVALLPQAKQILTVNNFTATIDKYDGITGQKLNTNIEYKTPKLSNIQELPAEAQELVNVIGGVDGMQIGKLYRANQGLVANNIFEKNNNSANYFVQADTGNYRLVSWQLNDKGEPMFENMAQTWIETNAQPYFFAYLKKANNAESVDVDKKQQVLSKWVVLESDTLLLNGKVQEYTRIAGKQVVDKQINIPLKDPTLLTTAYQNVIVADQSTGDMVNIDYSNSNFDKPKVESWQPTALVEPIESIYKSKTMFLWMSKLSLILLLAPFVVLFLLYRMGYNLNQKIG